MRPRLPKVHKTHGGGALAQKALGFSVDGEATWQSKARPCFYAFYGMLLAIIEDDEGNFVKIVGQSRKREDSFMVMAVMVELVKEAMVAVDVAARVVAVSRFAQVVLVALGDPRNIALLVHWDGFQTSRTTQKSCGVVEIMILNSGKYTSMGNLPVSFIPSKCKKIMKASGDVCGTCLEPLVNELESLYIEGLDVEFNYPIDKIFGRLDMDCSQSFLDSLLSKPREEALRIGPIQDLRNNPKEKEKVSSIIKKNAKNVQTIIVDGIPYKWEEDDIYAYVIKSLAAKRKWRKRKSMGSNTSSTTNSIVDNIITKSDSHNIEEEMQELENCASVLKMKESPKADIDLPHMKVGGVVKDKGEAHVLPMNATVESSQLLLEYSLGLESAIVSYVGPKEQLMDMPPEQATSEAIPKVEISQFSSVVVDGDEFIFLHDLK
ncbi:hypothetical protein L7F22_015465 [Adiantum nelumboides]|nr:hypothetical protein [Adiantum nelumboides]